MDNSVWVDDMSIMGNLSFSKNIEEGIWEQLRFSKAAAAPGFKNRESNAKLAAGDALL